MQLLNASFVYWSVCNLFTSTSACLTLEEKNQRGWIPAARIVLHVLFNLYSRQDNPRAFFVFRAARSHAAVACTGRESERAGLSDLFLPNRLRRKGGAAALRGPISARAVSRRASSPRASYTWAWAAIVRRQATCRSVPLAWKNGALTFSVDYKEAGKVMQQCLNIRESQIMLQRRARA